MNCVTHDGSFFYVIAGYLSGGSRNMGCFYGMGVTQFIGAGDVASISEIRVIAARNNIERCPLPYLLVFCPIRYFLRNFCVVVLVCTIAPPCCSFLERAWGVGGGYMSRVVTASLIGGRFGNFHGWRILRVPATLL